MQNKKALKIFCIWSYTRKKEVFHQNVNLYYIRNLTRQIIVKRLILVGQKKPRARWDYGKVVHYTTPWMTPSNVQDDNVFLTHVCISETSSKSASTMLSSSNISSDVCGAEQ